MEHTSTVKGESSKVPSVKTNKLVKLRDGWLYRRRRRSQRRPVLFDVLLSGNVPASESQGEPSSPLSRVT